MMRGRRPLDALVAGLRGRVAEGTDWQAVIALANHTLLTPALFVSLEGSGHIDRLPTDVSAYLRFIHERNRTRNLRLRGQLNEAVAALNSRGIVPVLLKGAIPLFLAETGRMPSRMTSDLDLGVEAAAEPAARACLEDVGYVALPEGRGMARAQDAGILEMRPVRPHGPDLPELVERDGCRTKVPHVQARAAHWIVHDLIKEGDYWRGRIDLRHLHDLAQLAATEDLQWAALRASMPDQHARNALDSQLLALHQFFGVEVPAEYIRRPMVRVQHWRRGAAAKHPVIGAPLRLAGNLVWGAWRLSKAEARAGRGLRDLSRRVARILLGRDLRSKI